MRFHRPYHHVTSSKVSEEREAHISTVHSLQHPNTISPPIGRRGCSSLPFHFIQFPFGRHISPPSHKPPIQLQGFTSMKIPVRSYFCLSNFPALDRATTSELGFGMRRSRVRPSLRDSGRRRWSLVACFSERFLNSLDDLVHVASFRVHNSNTHVTDCKRRQGKRSPASTMKVVRSEANPKRVVNIQAYRLRVRKVTSETQG